MQLQNGGGDRLASGASRAQFRPAGENITRERWEEIWADFDPEAYKKAPNPAQVKTKNSEKESVTIGIPK